MTRLEVERHHRHAGTMEFSVAGSGGRPVRGTWHGRPDAPLVLVLHGFKGFREWGFFPWIADELAQAGLRILRIDFSHNGVEERDFDRLDLFMLDTPTRHQEDLQAVARALDEPFGIVGHSRGGGDAILFAASEPRVRRVATLASVATTFWQPPDVEEKLRSLGYYPVPNARTKQTMPVSRHAIEDGERHSIEQAARSMQAPLLLIHGTVDESVPLSASERIASWHPHASLVAIEGAGHTFGAVHPWQGPTPWLEEALRLMKTFLRDAK